MTCHACKAETAALREAILTLETKLTVVTRQRDLSETRGHRWLNHCITMDDSVGALIEHIQSELRLGRGNVAHRRILARLEELRSGFPC